MKIINNRSDLLRTQAALHKKNLRLGFLGVSITAGEENTGGLESNWPYYIRGWFLSEYPEVRLTVNNCGIGGTGSLSGLMMSCFSIKRTIHISAIGILTE